MNKEILNPNCSETIWRLDVKKNTREEILKALENEECEDDTFETGRKYPDGCLNEMIERLDGVMDINNVKLIFEKNQGLEGASDYTEECFYIAKRFINGKITRDEANILSKKAWKDNVNY